MKNKIINCFIFLIMCNCGLAAQELPTGLKVGIQGGLSYAGIRSVSPKDAISEIDYNSIASYNINAYLKYQFSKRLGISIEPGIVKKGADINIEAFLNYPGGTGEYRFQYITMPIMLNYSFSRMLSIGVGVEPGYLSKSEFTSPATGTENYSRFTEDMDLGFIAGIDFGPVRFMDIGFRYSYGLFPVMKINVTDNAGNEAGERKEYNKMVQLLVRFNIINPK